MNRLVGTVARGIRAPIIRSGDDIAEIAVQSVLAAMKAEGAAIRDRDIVAVTESVVARAQNNYASAAQIAADVRARTGGGRVGIVFPITSRNRFSVLLSGMAAGCAEVVLMMAYPSDEVGNAMIDLDVLDASGVDPYRDLLTDDEFRAKFGEVKHTFTGVDYIAYYRDIIEAAGAKAQIILCNDCRRILEYTDTVIAADIHSRARTKRMLRDAGAKIVLGLDDILSASVEGSGYNPDYGLLGSNKATDDKVKLFPRDCRELAITIQQKLLAATGRHVEALIYGDGAFKDPVGKIWELADPVACPGCTDGLIGQPNELKLKYLADNDFAGLSGEALQKAITEKIAAKTGESLVGNMASQGTTPRRLTDLIASFCDLTSGSGDKGTPIIYIQGYFDNYANE